VKLGSSVSIISRLQSASLGDRCSVPEYGEDFLFMVAPKWADNQILYSDTGSFFSSSNVAGA